MLTSLLRVEKLLVVLSLLILPLAQPNAKGVDWVEERKQYNELFKDAEKTLDKLEEIRQRRKTMLSKELELYKTGKIKSMERFKSEQELYEKIVERYDSIYEAVIVLNHALNVADQLMRTQTGTERNRLGLWYSMDQICRRMPSIDATRYISSTEPEGLWTNDWLLDRWSKEVGLTRDEKKELKDILVMADRLGRSYGQLCKKILASESWR